MTALEKLRERSRVTDSGCWQWLGATHRHGYGAIRWLGRDTYAHRAAWEAANGPIPHGLVVDHLCRNRGCINPDHLEVVTNRQNVLRGIGPSATAARRNSCINGHEYTPENTYTYRGARQCQICRHKHREAWRAKSKRGEGTFSTSETLAGQK